MPHVTVKLWPGKTEEQKQQLAERITRDVMEVLHCGDESVSVAMEEIPSSEWADKVYRDEIQNAAHKLYKKPGYDLFVQNVEVKCSGLFDRRRQLR